MKQNTESKWLRIVNLAVFLPALLLIASCQRQLPQSPDTAPLLLAFRARFEARIQNLMLTNPQLVRGYKSELSPTRLNFSVTTYRLKRPATFSVEVEKSNQIKGYILLESIANDLSWGTCGDLKNAEGDAYGFTTEAGALAVRNTPACYESEYLEGGLDSRLRLGYLYSAGRWQLTSALVDGTPELENRPMTHVLVKPQADQIDVQMPESQALNQKWREAFLDGSF
jgi:hypothetical protein